jgi:type II secretory pathway component PulM
MQNNQTNAEFAKWWRRWRSRLNRIAVRPNPAPPRKTKLIVSPGMSPKLAGDCEFKRYLQR